MDFVKVYWDNGDIEYLKNDTLCADGTYRNALLLYNPYLKYKRIKRLANLPQDKKYTTFKRHNKITQDWEREYHSGS